MEITSVSGALQSAGYTIPNFNALVPDVNNYTVMLMQPVGNIESDSNGVRNQDVHLAKQQFGQFLKSAKDHNVDLAITPEYSMPWDTLVESIKNGIVPERKKLWVLGCESIKYSELDELKQKMASSAMLLYEPLQPDPNKFMDPLAYVFSVQHNDDPRIVMLIQFKTHPMGDPDHFEITGMQRGSNVYQFDTPNCVKLASLICSDAFAFQDEVAKSIYDRSLVIHIQMNEKPRHEQFLECRKKLFSMAGDSTELICLNWASDLNMCFSGKNCCWRNIAGSAWYLRPDKFDKKDTTLCTNHKKGLYYTWSSTLHAHSLFFNYKPAIYLVETSKVYHNGVHAAMSRRRGPQVKNTYSWNDSDSSWDEQNAVDDGFSDIVCGNLAGDEFLQIAQDDPLQLERIIAICVGDIGNSDQWHNVDKLKSTVIESSEILCRMTFCQDKHQDARDYRTSRMKRCNRLFNILNDSDQLPPALSDLKDGFHFGWILKFPQQNIISPSGKRATVMYLGEEIDTDQVDVVFRQAENNIHRASGNLNESHTARQRLSVWYRDDNDQIIQYKKNHMTEYDNPGDASPVDIGREP